MENKQTLWNRFFPCGIGSCRAELLSEGPRTDPLLFRLLAERFECLDFVLCSTASLGRGHRGFGAGCGRHSLVYLSASDGQAGAQVTFADRLKEPLEGEENEPNPPYPVSGLRL